MPRNPVETAMMNVSSAMSKAALSKNPDRTGTATYVATLQTIADGEIARVQRMNPPLACERGCDHCCHRVVRATIPEVIRTAVFIEEIFTAEEKAALLKRLAHYEHEVGSFFGAGLEKARPVCPLLVNHECSAYEARPLFCRGVNSGDVSACIRSKEHPESENPIPQLADQRAVFVGVTGGLRSALAQANLDENWHDFARALKVALESPEAMESYLKGEDAFNVARWVRAPQPEVPVDKPAQYPVYAEGQEPTGKLDPADCAVSIHLAELGDFDGALASLKGSHPIHLVRRLLVPSAYRSVDEIEAWRIRFTDELARFAEADFDPREAFDALQWLVTYNLAYQLNDVKPALSALGKIVCDRITARAVPTLSSPLEPKWRGGKLRLGYLSYNLRNSNGSKWALGWIANHAEDFETFAFNVNEVEDAWSRKFRDAADHYHHLGGNVLEAGHFIRSLNLDALIVTDIGMAGPNYQFGSMRLAPVQCTAWGHPVTSGLPTIDHYLSSDLMEPVNGDEHYTENLVRLPNSGLCYPRQGPSRSGLSKADFGLDDGPLYLNCQNMMKLGPQWDFLYRRVNELTGRPIVFLDYQVRGARKIIEERLQHAGVNAIWIPNLSEHDFHRLLSLAEVSLDPPGWSGGNTTIASTNLGVPVVTLPGEFMRGRHSLAFHKIAGCTGLIAKDAEDYVHLATDHDRRRQAMSGVNAAALYDDQKPVRALDAFLRRVCAP